ncbi:MAG: (2Fe-2S) ferredoxin domain-containing protein [Anaerolineae bacterium]|nr:(2Fe-2S) ferredoxin domain-containing protein [Anaerolineae bacterium]
MDRRADALYRLLEPEIIAINDAAGERIIKLEIANCLDMCDYGPNLVIYPEAEVFNNLDKASLIELIKRLKK